MKFYLISDNVDTQLGLRLAGIDGKVVHEPDEAQQALDEAVSQNDVAVVLVTTKIRLMLNDRINEFKLAHSLPLITEIPDRHSDSSVTAAVSGYIKSAIGIDIDK